MSGYKSRWSDTEREEYDALVQEAWESSDRSGRRNDHFFKGLKDAVQAHRRWATEVLDAAARSGAGEMLTKDWKANNTVLVSHEGRVLTKPRVIGVTRKGTDGITYAQQAFFDAMTVAELKDKRKEYLTAINAYDGNLATIDKLLALCEAGQAATPEDAALSLGVTVEAWLSGEVAA